MSRRLVLFIAFGSLLTASCQFFGSQKPIDGEQPLARVGNDYLYQNDIESIRFATTREDSAALISGHIKNWVAEKLLLEKAAENLPEDLIDIEKKVKDYRESLIIYTYEQELIRQKLDTNITINEIKDYYREYKNNFELEEDVYNIRYVKLMGSSFSKDSVSIWFKSDRLEERVRLEDFCSQFAVSYLIADTNWVSKNWILDNLPVSESAMNRLRISGRTEKIENEEYAFFVQIIEKQSKGKAAPLDYVKENIRKILLNKRRILLIENTYEKIYQEGTSKEKFIIY